MGPLSLSAISKMEPMQFVDHIILELAPTLAFTIKKMMAKIVVQDDDVGMFLADVGGGGEVS